MPFGPPVGGWFDAEGQVQDSSVFDFGPRTDVAKAAADEVLGTENDLSILAVAHAFEVATSVDARPTRNSHSRSMVVTSKPGEDGYLVAFWQNGAAATAGIVFSFSIDGGITWSVPVQLSSRTDMRPIPFIRPDTNDIFVFYAGIGTSLPTFARAMAYTGTPGSPSWSVGAEIAQDTGNVRKNYSGLNAADGHWYIWGSRTDLNPDRIHIRRSGNAWDFVGSTGSDESLFLDVLDIWQDVVRTEHFAGVWFSALQQGGTFRLLRSIQDPPADPGVAQDDTFFMTDSEEYSLSYNDQNDRLCLAYVNGGNVTFRTWSYNGTSTSPLSGPTVVSTGTCHSPLVQAAPDGSFYILWIHEDPSSTQRKIKVINTAAPTVVYDLMTDTGANVWHDLNGPRTVGEDGLIKFMVSETADATNLVWLVTVPVPVFKTVADVAVGTEGTMGVNVSFNETATGADSPAQTKLIAPGTCQDRPVVLDNWMLDTAGLDDDCVPNDVAENFHFEEVIQHGPGIAETLTATDVVAISEIGMVEEIEADDQVVIEQTVEDTFAAADVPTVDENPVGDQDDTATGTEEVTLVVHADDTGTEQVEFDVSQLMDEPVLADDQVDLDQGAQEETATGDDEFSIEQAVEEVLQGIDDWIVEPVLDGEVFTAVEAFDIEVTVDEDFTGTDSDPSEEGMSKDCLETFTATDAATVERAYGLSVRLMAHRGNVKLRVEGARSSGITVRNDPDG